MPALPASGWRAPCITAAVVERATSWEAIGAGLYVPANAVRALHELGIGPALAARANLIGHQRLLDHRVRLLADIDLDRIWNGVGGCVAIQRAALHEALRDATTELPVRLGTSVTDLEDGEAPRVSFSDGSTGSYDLVVGADGVHSTIRSLALGGPAASYVGQASWRFVADGFPDITDWTAMLGRGRTFLTVALGQAAVYCYADLNTSEPAVAAREDWRERFADSGGPVPRLLDHASEAYFAPIEEVAPPAWAARRVVLVGDAAHASSPNMAQGAAMAVEDALVLAEMLAADQSVAKALAGYVERRTARVSWVQEQTHRRDRTRACPRPFATSRCAWRRSASSGPTTRPCEAHHRRPTGACSGGRSRGQLAGFTYEPGQVQVEERERRDSNPRPPA